MFPDISGGAGGIQGGDTKSAAGDISSYRSSITYGSGGSYFGSSKMLMIGAGLLVALLIIKKV